MFDCKKACRIRRVRELNAGAHQVANRGLPVRRSEIQTRTISAGWRATGTVARRQAVPMSIAARQAAASATGSNSPAAKYLNFGRDGECAFKFAPRHGEA